MRRIEPDLMATVIDLERGLRQLGIPFGIVGALVPELLLEARPSRMTNDADVTVTLQSLAEFESLKDRLAEFNFSRSRLPQRMRHRSGGLVDILPFSDSLAPDSRLQLEEGFILNMAGFGQVVRHAVLTEIEGGLRLPIAPLPLYVLLKFVAFSDRKASKDLGSILHCLEHYLEDDDRRYGLDHDGTGVPYDYNCAYLLGIDGRQFLDVPLREAVTAVLNRFDGPDADVVDIASRAKGRLYVEEDQLEKTFELFRWYRLGAGL